MRAAQLLTGHISNENNAKKKRNPLKKGVKVRQNGQEKMAACLATLMQNELNSDVARFPPTSDLSCNKSGC